MVDNKRFYCYVHRNKKDNTPFYVGKGCRRRAYTRFGRNKDWYNYVSHNDWYADIIQKNLTENQAYKLEEQYIKKFKEQGYSLLNMNNGGGGARPGLYVGRKHAKETIDKIRTNGILGRTAYTHKDTNRIIFIKRGYPVPPNYIKGIPQNRKIGESFKNKTFYHHPITKDQIRINEKIENIPDGYVKGRANFGKNGNPREGNKLIKNFITGNKYLIDSNKDYPIFCANTQAKYAFVFDGKFTFNYNTVIENVGKIQSGMLLENPDKIISSKVKCEFFKKHKGKPYSYFIRVYNIENFINQKLYEGLSWIS